MALLGKVAVVAGARLVALEFAVDGGGGAIEYPGYRPDTQSLLTADSNGLALSVVKMAVGY